MEIRPLKIDGTFEVLPKILGDSRGYFAETYLRPVFEEAGITADWVQENQSLSEKLHTLRGLHYQVPPFAQAKLVRAVSGRVLDVFADLRRDSATYGEWDAVELVDERCNAVFIPAGFAHGFLTLSESVIVQYKVDRPYSRENEFGIMWNDPDLNIEWPATNPLLSERDKGLQSFADFISPF